MIPLQTQLLRDFVITQLAVIAQDQRQAIVLWQGWDGNPRLCSSLPPYCRPQRRRLGAGCLDHDSTFNFHNHLPSTVTAPQKVNALVASHPKQPSGERYRTVVALDGTLKLEKDFAGGIFGVLPRVQHVTAQAEYTTDIAAMDLLQRFGIVVLGAFYYALQIPLLHLLCFDLAGFSPFVFFFLASTKQYAADRIKLQIYFGTKGNKAGRLGVVLAGFELLTTAMKKKPLAAYPASGNSPVSFESA